MVRAANMPERKVHKSETNGAGHNSPLDGDIFRIHVGLITQAQIAVNAVKKKLKEARRRAQDAGIILRDLDEAMAMRDQEPETVQETIRRKATYAEWMGISPGVVQGDLFIQEDPEEDELKKAEDEGYDDGLEGVTAKGERYDTSNPVGRARLKGWNKGQDKHKAHLVELGEKDKAAKKEKAAKAKAKTEEQTEVTH